MSAKQSEAVTGRITVTPTMQGMIRDFCKGLDAEYSEGLGFLLSRVSRADEDPMIAGRRLRDDFNRWKAANG